MATSSASCYSNAMLWLCQSISVPSSHKPHNTLWNRIAVAMCSPHLLDAFAVWLCNNIFHHALQCSKYVQRSRGATGTCDQNVESASGVAPDLWPCGGVVHLRVGGVLKLLQHVGTLCVFHDLLSLLDSACHALCSSLTSACERVGSCISCKGCVAWQCLCPHARQWLGIASHCNLLLYSDQ